MSKLKRQAGALLGLPSRQVAGLLVAVVAGAGVALASLAGQAAVATCLLACCWPRSWPGCCF